MLIQKEHQPVYTLNEYHTFICSIISHKRCLCAHLWPWVPVASVSLAAHQSGSWWTASGPSPCPPQTGSWWRTPDRPTWWSRTLTWHTTPTHAHTQTHARRHAAAGGFQRRMRYVSSSLIQLQRQTCTIRPSEKRWNNRMRQGNVGGSTKKSNSQ